MPLRSTGRTPPAGMDSRQWARVIAQSGIQADNKIKTFQPTWLGFATDPVGRISYFDFGEIVALWRDTALTGISDEAFMVFGDLPEEIRPSGGRTVKCLVEINTDVIDGAVAIAANGTVTFGASDTTTIPGRVIYSANFSPTDPKGLPAGWLIQYTK